jgi:hypothetical protein
MVEDVVKETKNRVAETIDVVAETTVEDKEAESEWDLLTNK